ncbi:hypothetical protein OEZ86_014213 [Tetradesmus obliquus]|nr:hypothetical protein OEZ86_014213 [Tetradesmus obliquus]
MSTIRPLNISVNESDQSVWVDAGVKTIDLLTFLRHHVTPKAPAGYTLAAFPWFVYQSVAGAVATGTHGSSMEHNSMSNQVLALDVILANGTRRTFTNETDPFLMRAFRVSIGKLGILARVHFRVVPEAFRVSVGKLGILARVQFRIVPEVPVRRMLKAYTPTELLALMKDASASYVANGSIPHWMNETQIFWVVQKNQFLAVSFLRADSADPVEAAAALQNYRPDNTTVFSKKGDLLALGELVIPADAHVNVSSGQIVITPPEGSAADAEPYVRAQRWLDGFMSREVNPAVPAAKNDSESARTVGARWVLPKHKAASVFYGASNMAEGLNEVTRLGIQTVAGNLTAEPASIYIHQPRATLSQLQTVLYDQYEVSIPLSAMGSCWAKLLDVVYQGDLQGTNSTIRPLDKGFRTAPLIRFINKEDGLLSHTGDGPRMYLNIEDYLFYNTGRKTNPAFKKVMAALTADPACTSQ